MKPVSIRLPNMTKPKDMRRMIRRNVPKELLTARQKQREKIEKMMLEQESQNFYPLPMKSRKGVKEVNSSLEKIEKNLSLLRNMWKLTYEDTAHISEETLPMLDKRIKVMRELGFSWEIIKETLSREYTQLLKGTATRSEIMLKKQLVDKHITKAMQKENSTKQLDNVTNSTLQNSAPTQNNNSQCEDLQRQKECTNS